MDHFFKNNQQTIALEVLDKHYSFDDLNNKARDLTNIYQETFNPGECILVSSNNPFLFLASLIAFQKLDLVFCCWNGSTNTDNLASLVSAVGLIEFTDSDSSPICKKLDSTTNIAHKGDFIITTSGSTGAPKGVLLKLDNVIQNAIRAGNAIQFESYALDKWCIDIDFSLMSAISHLFMAWNAGIPLKHLGGVSDTDRNELFQNFKLGFGGAPLQLSKLSRTVDKFHKDSLFVSSGDFLTKGNIVEIQKRHPGISICTFYGLTELSGRFCFMNASDIRSRPGSAGRPIEGATLTLSENNKGEVHADTDLLFAGYYIANGSFVEPKKPYPTGDLGELDKDNYLWLTGRSNDTFKVSGKKVNRKKLEDLLFETMAGADYCVLPVEHEIMGTCCALFIANQNCEEKVSLRDIITTIKESLPSEYIPVYSYSLDSLPKLENGKLDKQLLIKNHSQLNRYR